jgi:hypothetical protein
MDAMEFNKQANPIMRKHMMAMAIELEAVWGARVHFACLAIPLEAPGPDGTSQAAIYVNVDSLKNDPVHLQTVGSVYLGMAEQIQALAEIPADAMRN